MIIIPASLSSEDMHKAFAFCALMDDEVACRAVMTNDDETYRSWERETVEHDI